MLIHKKVNFWSWQQNMVHSAGAKLLKLYSYYGPTFTGPKLSQIWARLNHRENYVDRITFQFQGKVKQSRLSTEVEAALGIVAGGDQEVSEDGQLVLGEGLLVLRPVVLVGSLEVLEDFFNRGRYRDGVMEVIC